MSAPEPTASSGNRSPLAMRKTKPEEAGHKSTGGTSRAAIPHRGTPPTYTGGMSGARIPALRQGAPRLSFSDENDALRVSMQSLKEIGILELLELDDRLCFILDLTDSANFQPGPLHLVFANRLLQASSLIGTVSGKETEEHAAFGSFPEFKAWTVSFVKEHEALDVALPKFVFGGVTWTCISLRKRFRVFHGVPTAVALSTSAASSDATRNPRSRGLTPDGGECQEEAQDYFGDARIPSSSYAPRSPLAGPPSVLKSPGHVGRSLSTALKSNLRQGWKSPSSPLAAPAKNASSGKRPTSRPSGGETSHPERHDSHHSTPPVPGFFDWTRLPMSPTLPRHIRFVKSVDWASTSLGPMETWSADLRLMCNVLMASPHPAAMYWGHDNVTIYNEPYIFLAGQKHPSLMGMKYVDAWKEIWDTVKESFATIKATGQVVHKDNDMLFMKRNGFLEETHFTWSLVPLVGRDGSVTGLYNPAFELTRRNIAERRFITIREVGETTAAARDVKSFWNQVLKGLEGNEYDVPFVLLYSVTDERGSDDASVQSTSSVGATQCVLEGTLPPLPKEHSSAPPTIDLKQTTGGLAAAFREALTTERTVLLETANGTLDPALIENIDCRGFPEKPRAAIVCPIHPTTGDSVLGFLLMGINPRRQYDDDYNMFVQILSRQLATSMASVVLYEEEIRRGQKAAQLAALDRIELSEQLAARTKEAVEMENKFTQMAELAPVGMFIADAQGKIVFTNDTFHQISQYPRSSDPNAWIDAVKADDEKAVRSKWDDLVHNKIPMAAQFRFSAIFEDGHGNKGETWALCNAFPETNRDDGSLCGIFGSITNISQQKWAEDVQIKRTAEANEMRLQQSRFVDIICHEIRNPLSAILQCADEISASLMDFKADSKDPNIPLTLLESNIDAAQTISLCSFHQTRVVNDVLTISKLDSALLLVTPVDVRPSTIVQQALKMFDSELHQADIKMDFVVDPSLADLNIEWVRFDPSRLLQVLINLTTNAIKFTSTQPQRSISIALSAYRDRPSHLSSHGITYITARAPHHDITAEPEWGDGARIFLQFAVQDTGKGLSESEKKLLFLRFSQASPKTHVQYGGSGLGLFISRELVELQGGEIGVASERGKGSTFAFYIQARASQGPPDGADHLSPMSAAMRKTSLPRGGVKPKSSIDSTASADLALRPVASGGGASGGGTSPMKAHVASSASSSVAGGHSSNSNSSGGGSGLAATSAPAPSFSMAGLRVLIVEDNEVNQRVLSKQLRNLGLLVGVANHGGECLEFLRRTQHWRGREADGEALGVILMDLEMPVMDGLTATREIRRLQAEGQLVRHLPIIAVYV